MRDASHVCYHNFIEVWGDCGKNAELDASSVSGLSLFHSFVHSFNQLINQSIAICRVFPICMLSAILDNEENRQSQVLNKNSILVRESDQNKKDKHTM